MKLISALLLTLAFTSQVEAKKGKKFSGEGILAKCQMKADIEGEPVGRVAFW